jgi:pimeloyl-ACP methyl ester carboxylesterase
MNTELYFEQQGSGPPIVFIHGSYATTSTWKNMVQHLANSHHCISIKLPGHCETPNPADFSQPSIETELTIVEQVVGQLTQEPIHLVGHSFGGVVALAQALKGTLNVNQMTLYEPVATWVLERSGDEEMSGRVNELLAKHEYEMSNELPSVCGHVINFWGGDDTFEALPDFIKDSMVRLVKNNIRHWGVIAAMDSKITDLYRCNIPTRLVYGDQSNPVAGAICNHLEEHLPNSNKYIIKGASHFLVSSHTDECLQVIADQSFF